MCEKYLPRYLQYHTLSIFEAVKLKKDFFGNVSCYDFYEGNFGFFFSLFFVGPNQY